MTETDEEESAESRRENRGPVLRRVFLVLLWLLVILLSGLILYLSWIPSSQLGRVSWLPDWLAEWADSGGRVETMRTGVPLAGAGFLFCLAWWVSGIRHWILSGVFFAVALVVVAEGGQFFLPARTPDWGDVWWGAAGALAGGLVAAGLKGLGALGAMIRRRSR